MPSEGYMFVDIEGNNFYNKLFLGWSMLVLVKNEMLSTGFQMAGQTY